MAKVDEQMSRTFVSVRTDRSFDEVVRAADRAADRAAAIAVKLARAGQTPGRDATYRIRRVGVVIGTAVLTIETSQDRPLVQLRAKQWLTTRPTFIFIPVGPQSSPALAPMQRFGRLLAEELGGSS